MQAEKTDTETEKKDTNKKKPAATSATPISNKMAGSSPNSPSGTQSGGFGASFKAFSKFGDTKSDGTLITLSQSDKWMKQAKVIDGKTITTTDTGISFKKQKSMKLGIDQYNMFLEDLANTKKVDLAEMKNKMSNCGAPGVTVASSAGRVASTVERLTDVSQYTGTHKQRFDQTGKGKGLSGRKDLHDQSGYVQGYQNKNTYDKGH